MIDNQDTDIRHDITDPDMDKFLRVPMHLTPKMLETPGSSL